jgi:hypothetical protein
MVSCDFEEATDLSCTMTVSTDETDQFVVAEGLDHTFNRRD